MVPGAPAAFAHSQCWIVTAEKVPQKAPLLTKGSRCLWEVPSLPAPPSGGQGSECHLRAVCYKAWHLRVIFTVFSERAVGVILLRTLGPAWDAMSPLARTKGPFKSHSPANRGGVGRRGGCWLTSGECSPCAGHCA